jgi:succinyl-CoA synthetase beta subunit
LNLFEYETKQEFSKHNISIPNGALIAKSNQTARAIAKLKPPYMVKAQVLVGGRGKAGGIIAAKSEKEAEEAAVKLLGARIRSLLVKQVLIEEKLPIRKELYLSIAIDRFNRSYVALRMLFLQIVKLRQKVYLILNHQRLSQNGRLTIKCQYWTRLKRP